MEAYVKRLPAEGRTVRMSRGLSDKTWREPEFRAEVHLNGHYITTVTNSSYLALGEGRSKRAPEATDAEILGAVLGDESVFD